MDRERERRSERGRKKERERGRERLGVHGRLIQFPRIPLPVILLALPLYIIIFFVRDDVSYITISLLLIFLEDVNSVLI